MTPAAAAAAILALASAGDHVVAARQLYGGTVDLLSDSLGSLGIEVTYVDQDDTDAWRDAVRPSTRAFFAETITNPLATVLDIRAIADVAHAAGVPLVVDNTVASPYLVRPGEHGADIVIHSATKFLGGHGTSIAGGIVDGGKFDFGASGRFPNYTEPDPSYHGLAYWPALGPGAFIINAGDALAVWTNDAWRSTIHRVLPSKTPGGTVRRSIALFQDGNVDTGRECLPTCQSAANPPKYAPITLGQHVLNKIEGGRFAVIPEVQQTLGERLRG